MFMSEIVQLFILKFWNKIDFCCLEPFCKLNVSRYCILKSIFKSSSTLNKIIYESDCKRYDGFELLRALPVTNEQLDFFKNITKEYDVNMWQPPSIVNKPVDFIISPDHATMVKQEAEKLSISVETLHDNIQSALDNQTVNTYSRRNTKSFNWHSFYRMNDIVNWMEDLKRQYPTEISVFSIGKTIEQKNIMAMKLVLKGSKKRSSIVIEGGIHAREWISTAVVTYIINELINARDGRRNSLLNKIAHDYEWYFIPVFNVDGYEYTHTEDRMWRKNRRGSYGVDLNRNFDVAFGTVGVTMTDKDSEEYCGPRAFSEPETQHIKKFMDSVRKPLSHYVSFHSYGQLFIIPYAYTKKHLENFDEMKVIGDEAARHIKKRHGTQYTVGTAYDTVGYMAAGVSACWAKKAHKIPYVAVLELRDLGKHGFALPASQILQTCRETMDGLLVLFNSHRKSNKLAADVSDYDDDNLEIEHDGQTRIVFNNIFLTLTVILVLRITVRELALK